MAEIDQKDTVESTPADLRRADVPGKYHAAGEIANAALQAVIAGCVEGADVYELCRMGDKFIEEKVTGIYNKKIDGEKPKKGVAFPTSICVNEVCLHYSPLKGESRQLKKGDLCKIDLGCHIDGFISVVGHTVDLSDEPVTGRRADAVMAAWTALEAAVRTIKPGVTNATVTEVMNKAVAEFKCNTLIGVQSHQMTQHVIDGSQAIISRETAEERVEVFKFEPYEVYSLDVIASTGDGRGKESDARATIFKRDLEQNYKLKTQNGRKFIFEVTWKYPTTPFSIASFEDVTMARVGVSECMRHDLLLKYPVITEKPGEYTARFKCTVLLLPSGTKKISGLPLDMSKIRSENSVTDPDLKALLSNPAGKKAKVESKVTDKD